jgi:DNA invertase Pin-like site-specific DNA recombinase
MAEKWKVAVYIRLARRDDDIIETQKAKVLRFAAEQGCSGAAVYSDNGASGSDFNREAFARMEADIQAGKINAVYVQSISRLGRNILGVAHWLDDIRQKGVIVKAMDGSTDDTFNTAFHDTFLTSLREFKRRGGKRHGA